MPGPVSMPLEETVVKTRPAKSQPKVQPPYAVVLHNDDLNSCEFVVEVLQKVFRYDLIKCIQLMEEAHTNGRSIVWTGQLEGAELKAEQIHSCGATPESKQRGALPLKVTIEKLPG